MKKKSKRKIKKATILFIILDTIVAICFFITYGPWDYLRNLYINTAMNTMSHQYLARLFYSQETIEEVMSNNYFITIDEEVNLDDIVIDTKDPGTYKNEYDKAILQRDNPDDLYKVLDIKVGGSNAYLVAIYALEKVKLIAKEE